KTVVAIGSEAGLPGTYPLSEFPVLPPENVLVDASDLQTLGLARLPMDVEINSRRRFVARSVDGFGSFLGSPYVFGGLADTRKCLGLRNDGAMFLLLRVEGRSVPAVQAALRERVPELDVLNKEEFSARAKVYWSIQTGAGGALLAAAVLGFIV